MPRPRDGTVIRYISAGTGDALTFVNLENDEEISFKSNGSMMRTTPQPDGSTLLETNGHNVVILFSTDIGGPATMLTNGGRLVVRVDSSGIWEVLRSTGNVVDICAALAN